MKIKIIIKIKMTRVYKVYNVIIKWYNSNDSSSKAKNEVFIGLKHGNRYLAEEYKKFGGGV